jgi:hypothetical protein
MANDNARPAPLEVDQPRVTISAATRDRVNEGLSRINAHRSGVCFDCAIALTDTWQREVPGATRCEACEAARDPIS